MAIAYQTQYNAIQAIQPLFPNSTVWGQYSAVLSPLVTEAQTRAIAGDADAISFLTNSANRMFLVNNSGADVTLNYNGRPWVFANTKSYCMHPDEQAHFIGQITQLGVNIVTDVGGASYIGGNGIVRFFFF
jgi:hypothetical protein